MTITVYWGSLKNREAFHIKLRQQLMDAGIYIRDHINDERGSVAEAMIYFGLKKRDLLNGLSESRTI